MAIYVDPLIGWPQKATSGQRYFGNGKESCHLATDGDVDELNRFALSIGLRRAWLQPSSNLPHYDLTPSRRAAAVRAGAIEVSSQDFVRLCNKRFKNAGAADV